MRGNWDLLLFFSVLTTDLNIFSLFNNFSLAHFFLVIIEVFEDLSLELVDLLLPLRHIAFLGVFHEGRQMGRRSLAWLVRTCRQLMQVID